MQRKAEVNCAGKAGRGEDDLTEFRREQLAQHHTLHRALEITQGLAGETGIHHDRFQTAIGHWIGAQGAVVTQIDIILGVEGSHVVYRVVSMFLSFVH